MKSSAEIWMVLLLNYRNCTSHNVKRFRLRDFFSGIVVMISFGFGASLFSASNAFAACTVSMSSINFGSVILSASPIDITGTLNVACDSGGPEQRTCVSIEVGSAGDATSRMMLNGGNNLRFDLFKDAARTQKWGSWETGYAGTGVQRDVNAGSNINTTVYARITGSQSAPPGTYVSNFVASPYIRYRNRPASSPCPITGGDSSNSSFTATVNVLASCTVATTNMNFGTSGFINSNIDATATVSPNCSIETPYSVSLSNGNTGTGPTTRKMVNGGNSVTYGLYRDGGRSEPWGSTIGTNTVGGTGNGSAQPITVYGRVPPQTTPPPATYTDTVIVTVTY